MSHATRIHAHLLKYTFHTDMTLHVYNWEKIYLKKKKKTNQLFELADV